MKATEMKMRKNYVPNKKATFNPRPKDVPFTIMVLVMATPVMVAATPFLPANIRSTYCEMCLALGKPCPMFKPPVSTVSLHHSAWYDLDVEEDWDGEKQKEGERKEKEPEEKELKNNSKSLQISPDSAEIFNLPNTFKDRYRNQISKTVLKEPKEEEKDYYPCSPQYRPNSP